MQTFAVDTQEGSAPIKEDQQKVIENLNDNNEFV